MLIKKLNHLYWLLFKSPEEYARHIGVKIGKGCRIVTRAFSTEPYLVTIGNNVAITEGVRIHTHGGGRVARAKYPQFDIFGKVEIKDGAYIGAGSQIMPGVIIGEGALVAAGSIVTKSVPAHMVVGGNPTRVICSVDDFLNRNKVYNVNTKGLSAKKKKEFLLSLPEDMFIKK